MKIGIVTVYNSMNYGAFLQAFAMKELLEERGHTVFFIKHNVRRPFIYSIAESGYKILCGKKRLEEFFYVWKKYFNYKKDWIIFPICKKNSKAFAELDAVLFGSDEIWNVKRKEINKYPVLFGNGFERKQKIAFAPSVNNATVEDFENYPQLVENVKSFQHIAVRGDNSQKVIQKLLNRDVEVVLDPTLLVERSRYGKIEKNYRNEKYILLYSYGNTIDENLKKKLLQFSQTKGYKIVSVLSCLEWCDESPQLSVGELISCFKNAELVFTNTFHGVALSIVFQKQFVAAVKEKQTKVVEMLRTLQLEERIVTQERELTDLTNKMIDYDTVNRYLDEERKRCSAVMDYFLENIEE